MRGNSNREVSASRKAASSRSRCRSYVTNCPTTLEIEQCSFADAAELVDTVGVQSESSRDRDALGRVR